MKEEEQKKYFQKIREKYNELFHGRNTIDKLLRDKIDDWFLLEEFPLPIRIGKKTLWVGNLNLENQNTFLESFAQIMALRGINIINFETIQDGVKVYECIARHKQIQKDLCKLISKTLLKNQKYYREELTGGLSEFKLPQSISYRYFKKRVTSEKLSQIMILVYKYNFDSEKKNLRVLAEAMGLKQAVETYTYSWLQNMVGLMGDFVRPQSEKSDSYQRELTKRMKEKEAAASPKNDKRLTQKA